MIEYANKDLFYQDSIDKQWTIVATKEEYGETKTVATIHNGDLLNGSLTLSEAISSGDGLVFGRCESSKLEFTVYGVVGSLKGCELTVDVVLNNDTEHPFRVGTYIVDSDKPTADRYHRKVVAYDRLSTLSEKDVAEWYKGLTFPITIKDLRDSFFEEVGITQETVELVQDNIEVNEAIDTESEVSAINILMSICEINGCFGHIGRDDVFHYIYLPIIVEGLWPADDLYPSDDLYPKEEQINQVVDKHLWTSVEYEDYKVKEIDGVVILNEDGEIAVATSNELDNPFKLEGNFLTYELTNEVLTTVANNLYSKIEHLIYIPSKVECLANPCLEVGDAIRFTTKEALVYTYVLSRTISGIQFLQDSIESTGDEDRSKDLNSISKQLARLRSKSEYDIDVNKARIRDLEADHVSVADLQAQKGRIDNLSSSVAIIDTKLYAAQADITTLESNEVTVNGKITALEAKCTNLTVNGTLSANKIVGGTLSVQYLDVDGIVSGLSAKNLTSNNMTVNGSFKVNGGISWGNTRLSTTNKTFTDGSGNSITLYYVGWS